VKRTEEVLMNLLTDEELARFRAFGYLLLEAESALGSMVSDLSREAEQVFDLVYPWHVEDHEKKLVIPMMSNEATPASVAFLENENLADTVEAILGPGVVTKPAKTTRFAGATGWHRDCYRGLSGIKLACYLERHLPGPVDFVVIPASHHRVVGDYVNGVVGIDRHDLFDAHAGMARAAVRNPRRTITAGIPTETVRVEPGQLLLFDLDLWHAVTATGGRLHWGVTFLSRPQESASLEDTVAHLSEYLLEYREPYPEDRLTYFPDTWVAGTSGSRLASSLLDSGILGALEEFFPDRIPRAVPSAAGRRD
jgi:ectoine hydroxylase-related dioxygenase (phytanoyl-CoA dioxygenase family)